MENNSDKLARDVYEKMMSKDHCSKWMGIKPVLVEEGHCILKMKVKKDMLNGFGMLHGGMAYSLADSAFAFASNSYGRMAISIQGSMNFHKSAKQGEVLLAEAKLLNLSYKMADFDVNIINEDGDIYYQFRGTVYRTSKEILND